MKETYYFSHDYNARSDVKIKRLIAKHGLLGYGIYWAIIEDLYQNANALPMDCESIAFDLRTDEITVESIIQDFGLFVIDGNEFGSISVERRLEERAKKSNKARESAILRWQKYANAMRTHSDSNAIKESKGKDNKENIIPMSGKPDGDVAQTSKDNEITTITEKWITYINSIFAKKYTSASWSKKIEGNIKKLLKAYGDKSKLSDNFKIVTKNILQDTFHIENNYRYVTPEYVSRLAVFDRFLNIEASQNNGRWRNPSDIVMCSDWIKRIPQPPNPLDVEACEQFCTDWKIAQLRTYQYEKTGCTNMIHDYEP
jgi:hypothetical protein